MIRALIIDDEPLARSRVRLMLRAHDDVEVVAECSDGGEAVQLAAAEKPDLLFLDIEMPRLDGFAAVANSAPSTGVVFVTAHEEHALKAFDASAIDYLVKPYSQERFDQAMVRVRRFVGGARNAAALPRRRARRERFAVRVRSQVIFVKAAAIDWIAAEGNYARLQTADGSYLIRESMQSLEGELDPAMFVRVHRSAIVNIERVRKLIAGADGGFSIVMQNDAAIPLGPSYRERLESVLGQKL